MQNLFTRFVKSAAILAAVFLAFPQSDAAAGDKRFILMHSQLDEVSRKVRAKGGKEHRRMEHFQGLVADLDEAEAEKLKKEIPEIQIFEDIEMHAVKAEGEVNAKGKPAPQPPAQQIPWGMKAIRADLAKALNRGAGVTVCTVDTGIDKTHADLQANLVGGRNYVFAKGFVDPNNWGDANGHGTHVAGIVAALDNGIGSIGVAPDAKLYGVRVLDARGSGSLSAVADGVMECVRAGAKVINMSLGATTDPNQDSPLKQAVAAAVSAGVAVVVAAGNEGQDIANTVPAGYPATIAVSAMDVNQQFPSWSNFGLGADDFAAPGVGIYSAWKGNSYNTISGTSMAAPHVAGVYALKLSSQSLGIVAVSVGKPMAVQGQGLVDALATVQNK